MFDRLFTYYCIAGCFSLSVSCLSATSFGEIKLIYINTFITNTTIWRRFALTYRYGIGIVEFNVPLDTV